MGKASSSTDGGPTCFFSSCGRILELRWGTRPLPALGTTHLRSGCPRAGLPAEAPGEGPPRLVQLLGAPGVRPWASGRLPPVSASVSTWLLLCPFLSSSVSYKEPVLGFRATPIQEEPHLRPFTPSRLQIPSFQVTPHSKVWRRGRGGTSWMVQGLRLHAPSAGGPRFEPWSGK